MHALARRILSLLLALLLALLAPLALAQAQEQKAIEPKAAFEPHSGQAGKDVVWVPTPQSLVNKMLDMGRVTKRDFVVDLGSGDGRTVIAAAKRGARAMGVEFNPDMVELSRRNAEKEGVGEKAKFVQGDFFKTDFSKATVVTMFLLPDLNVKLRPKLLKMRPGTRVVTNAFTIGDWEADETQTLTSDQGCDGSWCTAHLWIVPAKVAGKYSLPQGELELRQKYQKLTGTLTADGRTQVVQGKVRGREVTLTTGSKTLRGRMKGKQLVLS
jgi:precorrin-6B methylase 2